MEYKIIYYLTYRLHHFWHFNSLQIHFFFIALFFSSLQLHGAYEAQPHCKKVIRLLPAASLFGFDYINFTSWLSENILGDNKHKECHNEFKSIKVAEIVFPLFL